MKLEGFLLVVDCEVLGVVDQGDERAVLLGDVFDLVLGEAALYWDLLASLSGWAVQLELMVGMVRDAVWADEA